MVHRPQTPSSDEVPRLPSATPLQEVDMGSKHTMSSSPSPKRYRRDSNTAASASNERAAITNISLTCLNLLTAEGSRCAHVEPALLQRHALIEEGEKDEYQGNYILLPCTEPVDATRTDVLRGLESSIHATSMPPAPSVAPAAPDREGMRASRIKPSTTGKNATPTASAANSKPDSSGKAAPKIIPAAAPASNNETALGPQIEYPTSPPLPRHPRATTQCVEQCPESLDNRGPQSPRDLPPTYDRENPRTQPTPCATNERWFSQPRPKAHLHWWCTPETKTSISANQFVEWLEDQGAQPLVDQKVVDEEGGTFHRTLSLTTSVINLVFATDNGPMTWQWSYLGMCGSDHECILMRSSKLPQFATTIRAFKVRKDDWKYLSNTIKSRAPHTLHNINVSNDQDDMVNALINCPQDACAFTIPRCNGTIPHKPWWNEELHQLRKQFKRAERKYKKRKVSILEFKRCRSWYFQTVQATKRRYFNEVFDIADGDHS